MYGKTREKKANEQFSRPSVSLWGAPILFVEMSDGSMRLCLGDSELNKITSTKNYPLPNGALVFFMTFTTCKTIKALIILGWE